MPAPPGRCDAVVAFTAHHVVAAPVPADEVASRLPPGDLSAPVGAPFLQWLAARLDSPAGSLDVVLAAPAGGEAAGLLSERPDLHDHPRVQRAARYRSGLAIYTDRGERAVVVVGDGLAGRREVAIEVDPAWRSAGRGRALATEARALAPAGSTLFAQVAPGNAASLRAFLAAGFRPIGAEVLFLRRSG